MAKAVGEVLCIHYYFPPLRSTAVIRNYHISRTFTHFFQHVHVLTSDNYRRFPTQLRLLPKGLTIYDIPTFDYRYFIGGKSKKDAHISVAQKKGRFYQFLLKIQKSFPFNLFLAEGNLYYIFKAYRKAQKLIDAQHITTIYSSFGPYADHYVAYLLKRKYPHLRWIADFRDLQIEPIYKNVIWKGLQKKIEAKVLDKADLVTCISHGFVEQLKVYGRPTTAVLRGVKLRKPVPQFEKFTIAYTGSLYFEYRDPRPVFYALSFLLKEGLVDPHDLQIIYAGRDGKQFGQWVDYYDLNDHFINKNMVSQDEAKTIQNKAHINLLLTSSSAELKGVLTGKVFEYFEALNPTLCLISGVQDPEFESLFEELNAGIVVYNPEISLGKMRDFILSKYQEWKNTQQVSSSLQTDIIQQKYGWKQQVEKMF